MLGLICQINKRILPKMTCSDPRLYNTNFFNIYCYSSYEFAIYFSRQNRHDTYGAFKSVLINKGVNKQREMNLMNEFMEKRNSNAVDSTGI